MRPRKESQNDHARRRLRPLLVQEPERRVDRRPVHDDRRLCGQAGLDDHRSLQRSGAHRQELPSSGPQADVRGAAHRGLRRGAGAQRRSPQPQSRRHPSVPRPVPIPARRAAHRAARGETGLPAPARPRPRRADDVEFDGRAYPEAHRQHAGEGGADHRAALRLSQTRLGNRGEPGARPDHRADRVPDLRRVRVRDVRRSHHRPAECRGDPLAAGQRLVPLDTARQSHPERRAVAELNLRGAPRLQRHLHRFRARDGQTKGLRDAREAGGGLCPCVADRARRDLCRGSGPPRGDLAEGPLGWERQRRASAALPDERSARLRPLRAALHDPGRGQILLPQQGPVRQPDLDRARQDRSAGLRGPAGVPAVARTRSPLRHRPCQRTASAGRERRQGRAAGATAPPDRGADRPQGDHARGRAGCALCDVP